MKWFNNRKLSTKLLSSFLLIAVIAGAIGVIGILNIRTISDDSEVLFDAYGAPLSDIGYSEIYYQRMRVYVRDYIMTEDNSVREDAMAEITENNQKVKDSLTKFEQSVKTDEVLEEIAHLRDLQTQFDGMLQQIVTFVEAGNTVKAEAVLRGDMLTVSESLQETLEMIFTQTIDEGNKESERLSALAVTTIVTMIVIVVIGVLFAILLGTLISRIISNPIRNLTGVAEKLAQGDMSVNVTSDAKDEIGILSRSFGTMIVNIRNLLHSINAASEQVSEGAKQVSDSSIELSQGATEQASSIEELTASIEEIAAKTRNNADNANQANGLAETARTNAVQGNGQMSEMLKAMRDINESSNNISKIIKVIDEIAFQTNILALNAAVEAARAGQHGKGFAVVAEEVRNLAARSAKAAKETTDMIEGSIDKVEGGTRIANETANALTSIVEDVAKVANLVNDIAMASNEQAAGITQINQGIMQVSQVVQTNSATSEESAAASEELSNQAELLKGQVGKFKLDDTVKMDTDNNTKSKNQARQQTNPVPQKIALSDGEFGKYF